MEEGRLFCSFFFRISDDHFNKKLLLPAADFQINVADPSSKDAKWCIEQYFSELGNRFQSGFDPALSISAHEHELTPPAGLLLIVYFDEKPVGCGALKFHADGVGEIKRMWVSPAVRGQGVGTQLLAALENSARKAGISVLHLETNKSLVEAIALYKKSGYREVEAFNEEPYAHHWFEKRL